MLTSRIVTTQVETGNDESFFPNLGLKDYALTQDRVKRQINPPARFA